MSLSSACVHNQDRQTTILTRESVSDCAPVAEQNANNNESVSCVTALSGSVSSCSFVENTFHPHVHGVYTGSVIVTEQSRKSILSNESETVNGHPNVIPNLVVTPVSNLNRNSCFTPNPKDDYDFNCITLRPRATTVFYQNTSAAAATNSGSRTQVRGNGFIRFTTKPKSEIQNRYFNLLQRSLQNQMQKYCHSHHSEHTKFQENISDEVQPPKLSSLCERTVDSNGISKTDSDKQKTSRSRRRRAEVSKRIRRGSLPFVTEENPKETASEDVITQPDRTFEANRPMAPVLDESLPSSFVNDVSITTFENDQAESNTQSSRGLQKEKAIDIKSNPKNDADELTIAGNISQMVTSNLHSSIPSNKTRLKFIVKPLPQQRQQEQQPIMNRTDIEEQFYTFLQNSSTVWNNATESTIVSNLTDIDLSCAEQLTEDCTMDIETSQFSNHLASNFVDLLDNSLLDSSIIEQWTNPTT
jgi:hypothetical protein